MRDAFRHRLVLSYQALAEEVAPDSVLDQVLAAVPTPQIDLGRTRDSVGVKSTASDPLAPDPDAGAARARGRSRPRRCARSSCASAGASTACSPATTARRSPGVGSELWQVRPYEPGDDVRRIEWNVTARTGEPHVRVELAERVLVTWLVLDASASMAFGTADRRKADVAEGVALAVGHAATRRGNRLGLVAFGAEADASRRPRQGRRGAAATRCGCCATLPPGGSGSLARRSSSPTASRASARSSSSSPTSAARSTGARRCCGRRPAPDARGRDPRPARAGARRRRRAAARRSRDRAPAARRHRATAGCASASPAAAAEERARARRGCSPRPASGTSRSRPRATGCGRSPRSCAGEAGADELRRRRSCCSACSRSRLAVAGYVLARAPPRRARAPRGRRAALLPNMVERPPRWRRHVPRRCSCSALTLLLVGFARPQATINVKAQDATVVLVLDVSGSMAANDVAADAARAPRRPLRSGSSTSCRRATASSLSPSPTTSRSRSPPTYDLDARCAPRSRARRPARRERRSPTRSSRAVDVARAGRRRSRASRGRRRRSSCFSDGGQTAGRVDAAAGGRDGAASAASRSRRSRSGRPTASSSSKLQGRLHRADPGAGRAAGAAGDRAGERRHVLRRRAAAVDVEAGLRRARLARSARARRRSR